MENEKWCLIMHGLDEKAGASVYWGDTERECLDVGEQHPYSFVIIECGNVNFYEDTDINERFKKDK